MIRSRTNDQLIEEGIVLGGSPDTVCRQLERYERIGVDQIMLMMQVGNTTHDQVMRSLELTGKRVIPRFRAASDAPTVPAAAAR